MMSPKTWLIPFCILALSSCARTTTPDNSTPAVKTSVGVIGSTNPTTPNAQSVADPGALKMTANAAAAQSNCTVTQPTATDECSLGYPDTACNCASDGADFSACFTSWDDHYWSLQPAALQVLRGGDPQGLAPSLTAAGYCVDFPIMVWGWDPATTTCLRQQIGYTWIPSAGQAEIPVAPGLTFPGLPSYNPNVFPLGSIVVPTAEASCADYVADWTPANSSGTTCNGHVTPECGANYTWVGTCDQPPLTAGWDGTCVLSSTIPPAPPKPIVGPLEYGNLYADGSGDSLTLYPVGSTYTDSQGTFTKTQVNGLFGPEYFWTLNTESIPNPTATCTLTLNGQTGTITTQVGAQSTWAVTWNGTTNSTNYQYDWYGTENGVTDATGGQENPSGFDGPFLTGSQGTYTRYITVQDVSGNSCTTNTLTVIINQ